MASGSYLIRNNAEGTGELLYFKSHKNSKAEGSFCVKADKNFRVLLALGFEMLNEGDLTN